MSSGAGFREVAHTADWELQVWAPDLPQLLEQAALGMYALMGVHSQPAPRRPHRIEIDFEDFESLLVAFLHELLVLIEVDGIAVQAFQMQIEGNRLRADLSGAPVESVAKEVKAVTYHNLAVRQTERGLETDIVFDV